MRGSPKKKSSPGNEIITTGIIVPVEWDDNGNLIPVVDENGNVPDSYPHVSDIYEYRVDEGAGTEFHLRLPEVFGGGMPGEPPFWPPDEDPESLGHFIYGAPDGFKDGVILVLTTGTEKDEIVD